MASSSHEEECVTEIGLPWMIMPCDLQTDLMTFAYPKLAKSSNMAGFVTFKGFVTFVVLGFL